jgi:rod shape-determining protein MreD
MASGADKRAAENRSDMSGARRDASRRFLRPRAAQSMGRGSLALLGIVVVVLIQATLLSRVRVLGATPNLLLVTTIAWGLLHRVSDGVVWGFAGGLGLDLITGMPLGTSSLAAMTAGLLTGIGRNRVFATSLWWPMLLTAMATPVYGWIVLATEQIRGVPVDFIGSTMHVVGPELALNVAAMVLVYPVLLAILGREIR